MTDQPALRATLIAVAFAAVVLLVNPRGNFPLNDDWNFALAAWNFAETGVMRLTRFTGMSLRLQALWGAGWTQLFGQSFEVLRASTLTLSLLSLILFDHLAGRLGMQGPARWILTGTLLFHPIFLWSSFTFMTHIPFLSLAILAMVCFHRGLVSARWHWFLAGAAISIAAAFIRQTAIALLIAPAIVLLSTRVDRKRRTSLAIVLAGMGVLALLYFFSPWLRGHPEEQQVHTGMWRGSVAAAAARIVWNLVHHTVLNFEFAVIFSLPVALLVVPRRIPSRTWLFATTIAAISFLSATAWWVGSGDAFPFRAKGHVLNNLVLGPLTLRDTFVLGYSYPRHLPYSAQSVISYVAALVSAMLVGHLADQWRDREDETQERRLTKRLLIAAAVTGTVVLVASPIYFDRYALDSLWSLPLLLAITTTLQTRWRICATLLGVLGLLSLLGVSEYLDWNRARWEAFTRLQQAGVPLSRMDGGFEINQYLIGGFTGPKQLSKPGWSVIDDEYVLTFNPLTGYRVIDRHPYSAFLNLTSGAVLVQRRETQTR